MQKTVEAARRGWFADHIVPFEYTWEGQTYLAEKDETLRSKAADDPQGCLTDLAQLKPRSSRTAAWSRRATPRRSWTVQRRFCS
jgi:hypothetical protein